MGNLSDFLFARPSLAEGLARLVDFGDTLTEYNSSLSVQAADRHALRADWRAVGRDVATVIYTQLSLDLAMSASLVTAAA